MKQKTIYTCEVCGYSRSDRTAVEQCEATPIKKLGVEIGDIVIAGHSYGWWSDAPDFQKWFHEERGDPNSKSHLERAKLGYPKFVVLKVVPCSLVNRGIHGTVAHSEVAILYSPFHANTIYENKALESESGFVRKVGAVTDKEFAMLFSEAEKFFGPNAPRAHRDRLMKLVLAA